MRVYSDLKKPRFSCIAALISITTVPYAGSAVGSAAESRSDPLQDQLDSFDPAPKALQGYEPSNPRLRHMQVPLSNVSQPSWNVIGGLGFRGTRSEANGFDETLGIELGLGMPVWKGIDTGLGIGGLLKEGSGLNFEATSRFFLWRSFGGPYIGFGWRTGDLEDNSSKPLPSFTLGLFGGSGAYVEFDFRESPRRPLAAILEFGFRIRLEAGKSHQKEATQGPLVMAKPHPITWAEH